MKNKTKQISIHTKTGIIPTLFLLIWQAGLLICGATFKPEPGQGVFIYDNDPIHSDLSLRVFHHSPAKIDTDTRVWFVIHGAARNADGYFKNWVPEIENKNILLLAPEFTKERFPGSSTYNQGNILKKDKSHRPQEEWTYAIIERLFERIRNDLGLETSHYLIFGHSAGSQFTHRMLLLMDNTRAAGAVLGNAGWYTMPDPNIDFPYGLGGMNIPDRKLAKILQLPVLVLLGEEDTDENHPQLLRTKQAMAQGPHRFARGKAFFAEAEKQAKRLNVPFQWQLETVPGAAHSNRDLAPAAAKFMEKIDRNLTAKTK